MLPSQFDQVNTIKILVEFKADIEALCKHQRTPLHLAAAQGHKGAVQCLVDLGADISKQTPDMETSASLATKYKWASPPSLNP